MSRTSNNQLIGMAAAAEKRDTRLMLDELLPSQLTERDYLRIDVETYEKILASTPELFVEFRESITVKLTAAREALAKHDTLKHSTNDYTASLWEHDLPDPVDARESDEIQAWLSSHMDEVPEMEF